MEDDSLLDASEDEILVKDTQDSLATFSQNLIKCLGICRHNTNTDAVTNNPNKVDRGMYM